MRGMIRARQDPSRRPLGPHGVFRIPCVALVAALLANDVAVTGSTQVVAGEPELVTLLAEAADRSVTLRSVLDQLGRTQWRVFAHYGRCPLRAAVACLLHFVGDFRGQPYLRILVDRWRLGSRDDQMASLAHELYHALEAAESPDVVDTPSLTTFFLRIGRVSARSGNVIAYETADAVRTGTLVLRELGRAGQRKWR